VVTSGVASGICLCRARVVHTRSPDRARATRAGIRQCGCRL